MCRALCPSDKKVRSSCCGNNEWLSEFWDKDFEPAFDGLEGSFRTGTEAGARDACGERLAKNTIKFGPTRFRSLFVAGACKKCPANGKKCEGIIVAFERRCVGIG